jgi:hypothetical protein
MMKNDDQNPIVLRYDRNGYLTSRLPLKTMLSICIEDNDLGFPMKALRTLNAGHSYQLGDGSWLELENRHV